MYTETCTLSFKFTVFTSRSVSASDVGPRGVACIQIDAVGDIGKNGEQHQFGLRKQMAENDISW